MTTARWPVRTASVWGYTHTREANRNTRRHDLQAAARKQECSKDEERQ